MRIPYFATRIKERSRFRTGVAGARIPLVGIFRPGLACIKKQQGDSAISRVRARDQKATKSVRKTRFAGRCEWARTFAAFHCPCRQSRSWSSALPVPPRLSRHPMGIAYPINGHVLPARCWYHGTIHDASVSISNDECVQLVSLALAWCTPYLAVYTRACVDPSLLWKFNVRDVSTGARALSSVYVPMVRSARLAFTPRISVPDIVIALKITTLNVREGVLRVLRYRVASRDRNK